MQEIDREYIETAEAKNNLESWIYTTKDKLTYNDCLGSSRGKRRTRLF